MTLTAPPTTPGSSDDVDVADPFAALPVAVNVAGPLAAEVRDHVEAVLGWQPVDEATATLVPPALHLVSPETEPAASQSPDGEVPCVLLLPEATPATEAARAASRHRAAVTLAWPAERAALAAAVAPLLEETPRTQVAHDVVRVAGAAGGVGTSTITLALAGLAAWRGVKVLTVLAPGAPVHGVRGVPAGALAAHGLFSRATPLPGVPGARAVVLTEPDPPVIEPRTAGVDLVVIDAGRDVEGEVLVCRPDRAALERLETTTAGAVVVNGHGAASPRALQRAAGGRPLVAVPWSARVARAGLTGRVPASLPGRWLRALASLAPQPPPATST